MNEVRKYVIEHTVFEREPPYIVATVMVPFWIKDVQADREEAMPFDKSLLNHSKVATKFRFEAWVMCDTIKEAEEECIDCLTDDIMETSKKGIIKLDMDELGELTFILDGFCSVDFSEYVFILRR